MSLEQAFLDAVQALSVEKQRLWADLGISLPAQTIYNNRGQMWRSRSDRRVEPSRYSSTRPFPLLLRCSTLMLLMLAQTGLTGQIAPADAFRCPESYATDAERDAALKAFFDEFSQQHPGATIKDLIAERYRLLVAHDCRQTLANIKGRVEAKESAPQFVSPRVRSLTLAGHKFERVDEYYDARTSVWNIVFVDEPKHPESYANQLILNFYNWTPKATAATVASALGEKRRGTRNIFLFKAPDEESGKMVYHIVSLTRRRANFVNVMSVSPWEESAVNISFGHRLAAGDDLEESEAEARRWLLTSDGEALREATAALRVDKGWSEYLTQVK